MNHALEDILPMISASRLHGKNLACQRAMRLKARNIEGHFEAMVGVTKKIISQFACETVL